MTLHTVGPESMAEDEQKIGKGYQTWLLYVYGAGPFVLASYVHETKWLIAAGLAAGLTMLHVIGGRLHDLCIRLRRTNLLLRDRNNHLG